MAIAKYLSTETCSCAELVDENRIDVVSLNHPLLESPIPNSFLFLITPVLLPVPTLRERLHLLKP
jgi:hypothetical protein